MIHLTDAEVLKYLYYPVMECIKAGDATSIGDEIRFVKKTGDHTHKVVNLTKRTMYISSVNYTRLIPTNRNGANSCVNSK